MTLRDTMFRVIDTETTSHEPAEAELCEVAFADVDFDGKVLEAYQTLVNPGVPIPPEASAVHHLVDADVASAPPFEDVRPRLLERNASADRAGEPWVYVAHSADYDKAVLGIDATWICTHRLAKHLWPEAGGHGNQYLRYWLKLAVDLPLGSQSHRAAADVAVTRALLAHALPLAVAKWPAIETAEQLAREIAKPCRLLVVPFKSANGVKFADAEEGLLEWIVNKQAGGEDVIYTAAATLRERYAVARRGLLPEDDDDLQPDDDLPDGPGHTEPLF